MILTLTDLQWLTLRNVLTMEKIGHPKGPRYDHIKELLDLIETARATDAKPDTEEVR